MLSNRIDFRAKNPMLDKEGNFIMNKGTVYQEEIIILNVYNPNNRNSKYMKPKLVELQEDVNQFTTRVVISKLFPH